MLASWPKPDWSWTQSSSHCATCFLDYWGYLDLHLLFHFQVSCLAPIQELCRGSEIILSNGRQEIIGTLGSPKITSASFTPLLGPSSGIVSELVPNLQYGDVSLSGDLPIGGTIKVCGSFPVYGMVAVDGTLPSIGSAVVNTGCQFPSEVVATGGHIC